MYCFNMFYLNSFTRSVVSVKRWKLVRTFLAAGVFAAEQEVGIAQEVILLGRLLLEVDRATSVKIKLKVNPFVQYVK